MGTRRWVQQWRRIWKHCKIFGRGVPISWTSYINIQYFVYSIITFWISLLLRRKTTYTHRHQGVYYLVSIHQMALPLACDICSHIFIIMLKEKGMTQTTTCGRLIATFLPTSWLRRSNIQYFVCIRYVIVYEAVGLQCVPKTLQRSRRLGGLVPPLVLYWLIIPRWNALGSGTVRRTGWWNFRRRGSRVTTGLTATRLLPTYRETSSGDTGSTWPQHNQRHYK